MNELTTQGNGGAVAANTPNYFEAYGEQASQKSIVGTLLKFDKGDYLAGKDATLVDIGTQLIANMDQLLVGWIRWHGGKPTDQIMGATAKGYQAPKRNTLGDEDDSKWEIDEKTRIPKDPWSFSNYLVLKEPGENGELFTFTTSSRGGLSAIGDLCKDYGKAMRAKPNDYPVIQLRSDSYVHTQYGRIKTPVLTIVGWAPKSEFDVAGDSGDETETKETGGPTGANPASSGPATRF